MALTTAQIQNAYVAFFNRPADVAGLQYWSTYAGNAADLLNTFAQSAEYKGLYANMNSTQIVNAVYQNLFGRAPEVTGLNYWVGKLDNGQLTIGNVADAINQGALGSDKTIITNKTEAAVAFTAALDTTAEILAYAGVNSTGLQAVKTWLNTLNDSTKTVASVTGTDMAAVLTTVQNNVAASGSTFTLTTGADVVTGTSGNDVIAGVRAATAVAATDTLGATDSIDGGAGSDTLTVTSSAANTDATGGALISNVETINLRQTGAGVDLALDASKTTGVTAVNSYLSTGTVTVTNLASGASFGVTGNGSLALGATTASYVNTATAATINLTGGTGATAAGAVELANGTGIKSVTINSSGVNEFGGIGFGTGGNTADNVTTVAINASSNLTTGGITGITNDGTSNTITVSGAATKVDLGTLDADVDTVTASGLTAGGVVVTLGAAAQAVTGGAGADTVHATNLAVTKALDGGAGTDVISFTAATNYATTAAKATNFETLRAGGNGDSYNVALVSGVTAIEAETSAGAVTFTNVGASTPVTVIGDITGALGLTLADTAGTSDAIKVSLDNDATAATSVTVGALTAAGVETFNIVSGDALASGTANVISALTGSTSVKTINVSGTSDLTITNASAATALTSINASGFSKILTVTGAVAGSTITGGSGNDSFSTAFGTLGTTTGFVGGAGDDTLTVTGNGSDVVDGDFAAVSGIDNLVVSSATSTTVTLEGFAQSAIGTIDANSDGRLDLTATSLTTSSTINAGALTTKGVDIVTTLTNVNGAGANTLAVTGGAIADTITVTVNDTADADNDDNIVTTITAGNGIDTISYTATATDANDVATFVTTATSLANSDIITGFVANNAATLWDYNGTLQAAVNGNEVSNATLNGGFGATAGAAVYIQTTDIANSASNTQGDAFAAVLGSTASNLATNYATLEAQLLAANGALNGTISNLDAAIANGNSALLILDNGTGSVVLRITNTTTAANTITADEIDLVGVFTNAAGITATDLI